MRECTNRRSAAMRLCTDRLSGFCNLHVNRPPRQPLRVYTDCSNGHHDMYVYGPPRRTLRVCTDRLSGRGDLYVYRPPRRSLRVCTDRLGGRRDLCVYRWPRQGHLSLIVGREVLQCVMFICARSSNSHAGMHHPLRESVGRCIATHIILLVLRLFYYRWPPDGNTFSQRVWIPPKQGVGGDTT